MDDMTRSWRGSVLSIRGRLYLQVRDLEGKWRQRALHLEDTPQNRELGEKRLGELRAMLKAQEDAGGGPDGLTFRAWCERWLKDLKIRDVENYRQRLANHAYPIIGSMRLDEIAPRHLLQVVNRLKDMGRAPGTIRNVYVCIQSAFNDARIAGVLNGPPYPYPCILTHRQFGKMKDSPKFDRRSATYTQAELEALVYDMRLPEDHRVWNALLGLGMLRTGEAAGLRFGKIERGEPLGKLVIETSYDSGMTKTDTPRLMPVHPALAAILAEWRLSGWPRVFGRPPMDMDLVVPVPPPKTRGPRRRTGSIRTRFWARNRLIEDFVTLGFRHRRGHDLRRAGISLAQDGGADSRVLRWCTHAPPGETIDSYTTLAWATMCKAVSCLQISKPRIGEHGNQ